MVKLPTRLQARSGLSIDVIPVFRSDGPPTRFLIVSTAPGRGTHKATVGCTCSPSVLVCTTDHLGPYVAKLIASYRIRNIGNTIAVRNAARIREAAA